MKIVSALLRSLMLTAVVALITFAVVVGFVIQAGTHAILVPPDRALEDRHFRFLAAPHNYGVELTQHNVARPDGVELKGYLVERAREMGMATKTRDMQRRLGQKPERVSSPGATVILLHGRGGLKEDMLSITQRLVAADFRCYVYDARAHGSSGGRYSLYGAKEVDDLVAIIDSLEQRLGSVQQELGPVLLLGLSQGGAVGNLALATDHRIRAHVCVSSFSDLETIIAETARKQYGAIAQLPLIRATTAAAGRKADVDLREIRPADALALSRKPVFLIHGSEDGLIDQSHSERLLNASTHVRSELHIINGAGHSNALGLGGDDLYEKIVRFLIQERASARQALAEVSR